jgi:hypothetical protein
MRQKMMFFARNSVKQGLENLRAADGFVDRQPRRTLSRHTLGGQAACMIGDTVSGAVTIQQQRST